jgi:3-oxoacyl-[acyl-carrier protein] reductase
MMDLGLKDKVVLVTGGSSGIGKATVKIMAKEGAIPIIHYYSNKKAAENIAEKLTTKSLVVQADLKEETEVEKMFETIDESLGRIDILVCNAGIYYHEYVEIKDMPYKRWRKTLKTDLDGVFFCARAFNKQLEKYPGDYGSIIIIGSTAAVFGEAGAGDYATAKAAITYGLTKTLKNEIVNVAKYGRVNTICPGWVYTPMTADVLEEDDSVLKWILQTVPQKKIAQAEDIARMITILASEKASGHITGEILTISGGMEGRVLNTPEEIDASKAYKKENV